MDEPTPRAEPLLHASTPFGQRLRDLRRDWGLTQRELAWHLGISTRTVIRYEQGCAHQPKLGTLLTLEAMESEYAEGTSRPDPIINAPAVESHGAMQSSVYLRRQPDWTASVEPKPHS
jgi:DNA-binding XRE family transcriptional regulator